ncbi:CAP domain-containing protein, partial [Vibrio parahaemolyticus]|uniref:CAP domain-containing protein n=1 Tax=Vibrio parahaemolyticus TaxID=670 RepID=UPI001AC3DDBC
VSHNFFSHRGSSGSDPGTRMSAAGYAWKMVGENIAAGQPTMSAVLRGWLGRKSGHWEAIKNPSFTEMGAALLKGPPGNTFTTYWTL